MKADFEGDFTFSKGLRFVRLSLNTAAGCRFHPDPASGHIVGHLRVRGPSAWALNTIRSIHAAAKKHNLFTTTKEKRISKRPGKPSLTQFDQAIIRPGPARRRARP